MFRLEKFSKLRDIRVLFLLKEDQERMSNTWKNSWENFTEFWFQTLFLSWCFFLSPFWFLFLSPFILFSIVPTWTQKEGIKGPFKVWKFYFPLLWRKKKNLPKLDAKFFHGLGAMNSCMYVHIHKALMAVWKFSPQ